MREGAGDESARVGRQRDVGGIDGDEAALSFDLHAQDVERFAVAPDGVDAIAGPGSPDRERAADPRRGARYEHRLHARSAKNRS